MSRAQLHKDFTINLTQATQFTDRLYHIIETKIYTFHVSTFLKSISDKITMKNRYFLPKIEVLDEKATLQTFHTIHFIVSTCNVCLLETPECFAHISIQLLATHVFKHQKPFQSVSYILLKNQRGENMTVTQSACFFRRCYLFTTLFAY